MESLPVNHLSEKKRKKLLTTGTWLAVGLASVGTVVHNPHNELKPEENITDVFNPREYDLRSLNLPPQKNGEVKTPYGVLPIEGLGVKVNPSSISIPADKIVKITAIELEPEDAPRGEDNKLKWQRGMSLTFNPSGSNKVKEVMSKRPMNISEYHQFSYAKNDLLYDKSKYLPISGAWDGAILIEEFDSKTGTIMSAKTYNEELTPTICKNGTPILAEVSSSATIERTCHTIDLYKPFIKNTLDLYKPFIRRDILVVIPSAAKPSEHNDHFDPDDDVVRTWMPEYQQIGKYQTDIAIPFHELGHVIYEPLNVKGKTEVDKAVAIIDKNNRTLRSEEVKTSFIEDQPIWKVFTESTYQDQLLGYETAGGHPYDNSHELFASTLSVLRTFPDRFAKEYAKLTDNERQAASKTVIAVIHSLQSVNPDKTAIKQLLPQLPDTLKKLAADPVNKNDSLAYTALLSSLS